MLTLKNINITLGTGSKLARQVLKGLTLDIRQGEFIVVIGGNGSGKSTMLNVISGFLKPDSGEVIIDNLDVTKQAQHKRSAIVAKVMQDPKVGTMEDLTIFENLAFALKRGSNRSLALFSNQQRKKLFQDKLAMLDMGLENRMDDPVYNLSGGQRQALSLIMAIIQTSKILLLDEMTAALDPKAADSVIRIASKIIAEEKRTTIMITHNMHDALRYGDRTLLLSDGKFVKEFTKAEKAQISALELAAEFGEI